MESMNAAAERIFGYSADEIIGKNVNMLMPQLGSPGLEPRQHQLMLAVKGLPEGRQPRIADLAERLQIRHHSAVELVGRLVTAGLVVRTVDAADHRRVILGLTRAAEALLAELSAAHLDEIARLRPSLKKVLARKVP